MPCHHTMPVRFGKGIFHWKCIKCFPSTLCRGNATIAGHFVFEEVWGRKIAWLSWLFEQLFSKCSPSTGRLKAGIFKFLWCEECFWKAPFSWSWWIGVDSAVGLTIEITLRFQSLICYTDSSFPSTLIKKGKGTSGYQVYCCHFNPNLGYFRHRVSAK